MSSKKKNGDGNGKVVKMPVGPHSPLPPPQKQPVGVNAQSAPVMNPTQATGVEDLPDDAVALLVYRGFTGPQPMTIVVTLASWLMNKQVLMDGGMKFDKDRIYEFESPTNPKGRRTTFHLQDVTGWAANIFTGKARE